MSESRKGVNVFMIMGKLRSLDKDLKALQESVDRLNVKVEDIREVSDQIRASVVKALERSE